MKDEQLCCVIRDLLPLYNGNDLCEETGQLIEEHLVRCAECRQYYDTKEREKKDLQREEREKEGRRREERGKEGWQREEWGKEGRRREEWEKEGWQKEGWGKEGRQREEWGKESLLRGDQRTEVCRKNDRQAEEEERLRYLKIAKRIRKRRIVLLLSAICLTMFLVAAGIGMFQPAVVSGTCMEPLIKDQEQYFLNRWSYKVSNPKRKDVVIFEDAGIYYITRIAGLPGERIAVKEGKLYVNGVSEPGFTGFPADFTIPETVLDSEEYLVLVDNRSRTADTKHLIHKNDIIGKVWITH